MTHMAKMTLEKLATMIKHGFDSVENRLFNVEVRLENIENRTSCLEIGQEDILLKLDNYSYKFEVNDLKKRVAKIEQKMHK
jgi:hypothetical protein